MGFVKKVWKDVTGQTAGEAAIKAANIQAAGAERGVGEIQASQEAAQGFLAPFQQLGQQGIEQASFLTDPNAQFEFLQSNPLFQSALNQMQSQTQNLAAARGRLSAGDTLEQLGKNVLLAASPLITEQKRSINDLLNIGTGIAGGQAQVASGGGADIANLVTSGAAARAAGEVGAAQASAQGTQNLINSAILAGSLSDTRLKENIRKTGSYNGFNIYSWTWNSLAKPFGLSGESSGVLAQEVIKTNPDAVTKDGEYYRVNYQMIGVPHGA